MPALLYKIPSTDEYTVLLPSTLIAVSAVQPVKTSKKFPVYSNIAPLLVLGFAEYAEVVISVTDAGIATVFNAAQALKAFTPIV